jgi:uncharacterized membrane protein
MQQVENEIVQSLGNPIEIAADLLDPLLVWHL